MQIQGANHQAGVKQVLGGRHAGHVVVPAPRGSRGSIGGHGLAVHHTQYFYPDLGELNRAITRAVQGDGELVEEGSCLHARLQCAFMHHAIVGVKAHAIVGVKGEVPVVKQQGASNVHKE
jgi:hypothetical protein